jgi:SecD/SecF fusion protein
MPGSPGMHIPCPLRALPMRNIIRSAFIVLVVLIVMSISIYPPKDNLRLGKDLRGGVSLVYSVQNRGINVEDAKETINRTIEVLKNRVDPDGLFEISMVAQGTDRLEVTMPLPSQEVITLKAAYEKELEELAAASITRTRVDNAIKSVGAEQTAAIAAIIHGNTKRKEFLDAAVAAWEEVIVKRVNFESEPAGPQKDALAAQVATAEIAYDAAVEKVMETALSADEIRNVVNQSSRLRAFQDRTGKTVTLPSPREASEKALRESHPYSLGEIDKVINAHNAYIAVRKGLDDPEELKRMLRGSGVLSFRISVNPGEHRDEAELRKRFRELGPRNANTDDARWFRLNRLDGWLRSKEDAEFIAQGNLAAADFFQSSGYVVESFSGDYFMLCWDTPGTRLTSADHRDNPWAVAGAFISRDEVGRNAIGFRMDSVGGRYLGELTGKHVGKRMAVLLDDQVYTSPVLQSAISTNGQISGDFSQQEIDYIIRTLSGGSLQASLSPDPISEDTIAPQLGADNLQMGLMAGVYSAILIAIFMVFYYFTSGFIAVVALTANAVIIIGAMALSKAAFTMPGIAGVILTFGMALDSNVLIFERMREELQRGCDLKTAVRLGFNRALSSIVDGNVTNLIVCVVLYYVGTAEIRGFAITMGIGVVSTLFAALVISRLIFDVAIQLGWKKTSMLPMAIPGLQAALTPRIDWLKYRYVFYTVSAAYVLIGLVMIFGLQGRKLLDNQFLGGTKVTLQLKEDPATGKGVTMTRKQVEERISEIVKVQPLPVALRPLQNAEIIPLNPERDGITAERFDIKVGPATEGSIPDPDAIPEAIKSAFADVMDVKPALEFAGSDSQAASFAPAYLIDKPVLGDNIDLPQIKDSVAPFVGGVAIVLNDIQPRVSLDSLRSRLETVRKSSEFSSTLSRQRDVIIIKGVPTSVESAVVVVRDDSISAIDDEAAWTDLVKTTEWNIVNEALTKSTNLAGNQQFSSAVADTFRAQALWATVISFILIGLYIWWRFQTLRYSLAAVIALVHDVIAVTGMLALCGWLYDIGLGDQARSLGILPFKIDLNIVAALLTIAGYSLNDTVVIMDRIRENRGKLPYATAAIINESINQTFSRTLITGGTTIISCLVLYTIGGEGMRAFAFCLLAGLIFGTYSSVAVAAPIVWDRLREDKTDPTTAVQPATLH